MSQQSPPATPTAAAPNAGESMFGAAWRRSLVQDVVSDLIRAAIIGSAGLLIAQATSVIHAGQPAVIFAATVLASSLALALLILGAAKSREGGANLAFVWAIFGLVFGVPVALIYLEPRIPQAVFTPILYADIAFIFVISAILFGLWAWFTITERRKVKLTQRPTDHSTPAP